MALAPLLYNITFDSQTRILYFWDKAGHEIYHCEIPSPAPVFPLDLIVGMSIDNSTGNLIAVTFDYPLEENYWNTRVKSADDKELLQNLGLWVDYPEFLYGSVLNTSSYRYEIIEIYTGVGEGVAPFDLSKFYIPDYQKLSLGCTGSYSTPVKSWKLRITPAPAMPTVSMSYAYPNQLWNYSENIGAGGNSVLRDQNGNPLSYDSTKSYSALNYYTSTSDSAGTIDTNVSIGASGSFLALFNNGSSQITVQRVNVATCDSTDATVITVYDSSSNPYNAFKYTSDGTDYYYVLDGTQTDWTDDLASIGYHLPAQTLELLVWVSDSVLPQIFGANDYWYSRIGSESDVQALIDFGGEVITDGQYKYIKVLNTLFYDLVNMYGGANAPIPSADLSNFWLAKGSNNHSGSLYIRSINAYSTPIKTWRVRITENKDNVSWMMPNQSDVFIGYAGSHQLYDASGNTIPYDSTKTYTIVGYYTGANYVSLDDLNTSNNQHFSIINYNSSGYLGIKSSDSSTDYLIQRVIYKVE